MNCRSLTPPCERALLAEFVFVGRKSSQERNMEEKDEEGEISTSMHTYVLCTHVHVVRPIMRLRVGS